MNEQILFDNYGRRIPPLEIKSKSHKDTRRYFICSQPEIDYIKIHSRIKECCRIQDTISATDFEERCETIFSELRDDPRTENITKGVAVPFFLPQAISSDIGSTIEEIYLPAIARSVEQNMPGSKFTNHCQQSLSGKLRVASGSRHEHLFVKR